MERFCPVPVTPLGRFAGLLMMLAGLAALGTVSAVLADMFRGQSTEGEDKMVEDLVQEVKQLRQEVASLSGLTPPGTSPTNTGASEGDG